MLWAFQTLPYKQGKEISKVMPIKICTKKARNILLIVKKEFYNNLKEYY
jgi:hypothetical protein